MKKIIALLFVCLLSAGCTAQYNLKIYDDKISEETNLYFNDNNIDNYMFKELTNSKINVYLGEKKYYKVDYTSDNNYFNYKYTHKLENYSKSKIINWCYNNRNIYTTKDKFVISTTGRFECINFESQTPLTDAEINITTDFKVVKNNADKVNGNTYTWLINKENYLNKPIYMEIQFDKQQSIFNNFQIQLALILLTIILVAFIIYIFVKKKGDKNNSI